MSNKPAEVSIQDTEKLMSIMWRHDMKDDLVKWVMFTYPWGKPNTPLANLKAPRKWQLEELQKITDHIANNKRLMAQGKQPKTYKLAVVSGRGPGKSTLVAWVTHWFLSTVLGGTAVISANTEIQLTSKTFAEIGKWLTLGINNYWFDRTSRKITPKKWFAEAVSKARQIDDTYYYAEGNLWNEDNPDAFAGVHNPIGILLIFDEASGIPAPIWSVSEGFFTDLSCYRFWLVLSNPRSNTGPFFECFHEHRDHWRCVQIDARSVEEGVGVDHEHLRSIVERYGEDSDEARVEVKGEFPSQGDRQFIPRGLVIDAQTRDLQSMDDHAALLMGVDPARFGEDSTIIRFRRGRDARSYPVFEMKGRDNMTVANKCAELIDEFSPDGVFIDSGAGGGIIDRLREMNYHVHEVGFGTASEDSRYFDHRTELWAKMRDWLTGAMIDSNKKLRDDLTGPEYEFMGREDRVKLEAKEKMKKRSLASPDHADALAVTFHCKVLPKNSFERRFGGHPGRRNKVVKGVDFDPFS